MNAFYQYDHNEYFKRERLFEKVGFWLLRARKVMALCVRFYDVYMCNSLDIIVTVTDTTILLLIKSAQNEIFIWKSQISTASSDRK